MSFNARGSPLDTKTYQHSVISFCLPLSSLHTHTHTHIPTHTCTMSLQTSWDPEKSSFSFSYHTHIFSITSVCWAVLGGKEERERKLHCVVEWCPWGLSLSLSMAIWQLRMQMETCHTHTHTHTKNTHTRIHNSHTHGWLTDWLLFCEASQSGNPEVSDSYNYHSASTHTYTHHTHIHTHTPWYTYICSSSVEWHPVKNPGLCTALK